MSKVSTEELENLLSNFYGTEHYYKVSPFSSILITDGVKAFADKCECYWLFTDFIMPECTMVSHISNFLVVEVKVTKTGMCTITAKEDTDMPPLFTKKQRDICNIIPKGTHKFYCIDNILLLPSEY